MFLLTLPWEIVQDFGVWTIPITFLTWYFIVAAEGTTEHVEQPFCADGDGLEADSNCNAIDSSVHEIRAPDTIFR